VLACCASSPSDETPTGALKMFLDAMERSAHDSEALREAYYLVDQRAQARLRERAQLATALGAARDFEPWEMLAQARFRLRFHPADSGGMRERVHGRRAVVIVTGRESQERAEVPLVKEGKRWRVVLEIPVVQRARETPSMP